VIIRSLGQDISKTTTVKILLPEVRNPQAGRPAYVAVSTREVSTGDFADVYTTVTQYMKYRHAVLPRSIANKEVTADLLHPSSTLIQQYSTTYYFSNTYASPVLLVFLYLPSALRSVQTSPSVVVTDGVANALASQLIYMPDRSLYAIVPVNAFSGVTNFALTTASAKYVPVNNVDVTITELDTYSDFSYMRTIYSTGSIRYTTVGVINTFVVSPAATLDLGRYTQFSVILGFQSIDIPQGGVVELVWPESMNSLSSTLYATRSDGLAQKEVPCRGGNRSWICELTSALPRFQTLTIVGDARTALSGYSLGNFQIKVYAEPSSTLLIANVETSTSLTYTSNTALNSGTDFWSPLPWKAVTPRPILAGQRGPLVIDFQPSVTLQQTADCLSVVLRDSNSFQFTASEHTKAMCIFTGAEVPLLASSCTYASNRWQVCAPTHHSLTSDRVWRLSISSTGSGLKNGLLFPANSVSAYTVMVTLPYGYEFQESVRNLVALPTFFRLSLMCNNAGYSNNFAYMTFTTAAAASAVSLVFPTYIGGQQVFSPTLGLAGLGADFGCGKQGIPDSEDRHCVVTPRRRLYFGSRVLNLEMTNLSTTLNVQYKTYFGGWTNPKYRNVATWLGFEASAGGLVASDMLNFFLPTAVANPSATTDQPNILKSMSSRLVGATGVSVNGLVLGITANLAEFDYMLLQFSHGIAMTSAVPAHGRTLIRAQNTILCRVDVKFETTDLLTITGLQNPAWEIYDPVLSVSVFRSGEYVGVYRFLSTAESNRYVPNALTATSLVVAQHSTHLQYIFQKYTMTITYETYSTQLGFVLTFPFLNPETTRCVVENWDTVAQGEKLCQVTESGKAQIQYGATSLIDRNQVVVHFWFSPADTSAKMSIFAYSDSPNFQHKVREVVDIPTFFVANSDIGVGVSSPWLLTPPNLLRTGDIASLQFKFTPVFTLLKGTGRLTLTFPNDLLAFVSQLRCIWNNGYTAYLTERCSYGSNVLTVFAPLRTDIEVGTWTVLMTTTGADRSSGKEGFVLLLPGGRYTVTAVSQNPTVPGAVTYANDILHVLPTRPRSASVMAFSSSD